MIDIQKEVVKARNLPFNFFSPTIKNTYLPDLLLNIDNASSIFNKYIKDYDKKITIFADPDIDGIMSSVILYKWIAPKHKRVKVSFNQRSSGHGIIPDNLNNTDLLIIVDSSSNFINEVGEILSKNKAKHVLILDHHPTNGKINSLKNAVLINPLQPGDNYPNKEMSGGLVVTKFLEHVEKTFNYIGVDELLDLTAISIYSDVMNVFEMENRYYFYKGMELIRNKGLAYLGQELRIDCCNVTSRDLGFKLNKALNSSLRLENISAIFKLILEYNSDSDYNLIKEILNDLEKRTVIEQEILSEIEILYNGDGIVIAKNNYNKNKNISINFNGVIASKMVDLYSKNVVIIDGALKGSCRAYSDFKFKDYINGVPGVKGEGHQGAFGIKISDMDKLKDYISKTPPVFELKKDYDIVIDFKDLSKPFFEKIKEIQYLTGKGFDLIKFKITNIKVDEIKETTGNNIYYISKGTKSYIRFLDKMIIPQKIEKGFTISVIGTSNINEFFGKKYYEIHCDNIIIDDNTIDDSWGIK